MVAAAADGRMRKAPMFTTTAVVFYMGWQGISLFGDH